MRNTSSVSPNRIDMELTLLENDWSDLSTQERRDKLVLFEQVLKSQSKELNNIVLEPTIYSADGVYAREITIPAGCALVGEIHLKEQINVVSKGTIRVATEEGVRTITAPSTFISPAGTKRAGYAIEETIWTTFLPTHKTEDKDVYEEFIAPDYKALDNKLENTKCHSLQQQ